MNNTKIIELVVLLQGNWAVAKIDGSDESKLRTEKLLVSIIQDSYNDPFKFLKLGDITVFGKYIMGWYFRQPVENTTDKLLQFIDKKLPDKDEGEEWRGQ